MRMFVKELQINYGKPFQILACMFVRCKLVKKWEIRTVAGLEGKEVYNDEVKVNFQVKKISKFRDDIDALQYSLGSIERVEKSALFESLRF